MLMKEDEAEMGVYRVRGVGTGSAGKELLL